MNLKRIINLLFNKKPPAKQDNPVRPRVELLSKIGDAIYLHDQYGKLLHRAFFTNMPNYFDRMDSIGRFENRRNQLRDRVIILSDIRNYLSDAHLN